MNPIKEFVGRLLFPGTAKFVDELMKVSQVTRTAIIRRKRPDWWPMHNRLIAMQQIARHT